MEVSMSDSDTATTYVFAPEDIVWHKTDLGPRFWLGDNLVGTDYTSVFSAQLTKSAQVADPHRIATPTTTRSTS
jgi:hypothetical protein